MYKAEAFVPSIQCNNYHGKEYEKCIAGNLHTKEFDDELKYYKKECKDMANYLNDRKTSIHTKCYEIQ